MNLQEQISRMKSMIKKINEIDLSNTYIDTPKDDIKNVKTNIFSNSPTSEFIDYGISFLSEGKGIYQVLFMNRMPDEFYDFLEQYDEQTQDEINTSLTRIYIESSGEFNRIHFREGIHPYLKGLGIGYIIYEAFIKFLGFASSTESATTDSRNVWKKLLNDPDFRGIFCGNENEGGVLIFDKNYKGDVLNISKNFINQRGKTNVNIDNSLLNDYPELSKYSNNNSDTEETNLQEQISRMKSMMGLLVENKKTSDYKGTKRIILIGPPTVGKSTVAEELSKQLNIEYVKLDKLQEKFGYGEGKEFELVQYVLSPDFEKYNTSSILDFGGGHVYNKGVKELLMDYPNVFLLMPSEDSDKSEELLRKGNTERWTGFMDQIIQGLKSGKHKHSKEKESKLIDKLEKMKKGEGGKFDKEDLPDTEEMKGWGGLNMDKDWNKFVPLSKEEDKKNKDISKHIISVYDEKGERRNKTEIAKDIINLL